MTYAQIYSHFLEKVREEIPVYHKTLGNDLDGFYDVEFNFIVVNKKLKGTKRGFFCLAHEWQHKVDHRNKKFPSFFSHHYKKYSEERMAEVIAAEQSAGRGAQKIAASYGKKYSPEETNPKELPHLIKFWKSFYFKK